MTKSIVFLCAVLFVFSEVGSVRANSSYNPWIHSLIQKGADVEVTINIFDEASAETFEVGFFRNSHLSLISKMSTVYTGLASRSSRTCVSPRAMR